MTCIETVEEATRLSELSYIWKKKHLLYFIEEIQILRFKESKI